MAVVLWPCVLSALLPSVLTISDRNLSKDSSAGKSCHTCSCLLEREQVALCLSLIICGIGLLRWRVCVCGSVVGCMTVRFVYPTALLSTANWCITLSAWLPAHRICRNTGGGYIESYDTPHW